MSKASQIKIQIYNPAKEELCDWEDCRIDGATGLDGIDPLAKADVIRVFVGGLGFGYWPDGGHEDDTLWYEFSGDDEYALWEDGDYLYVAAPNPKGDTRLTEMYSFPNSGNLEGKISRLRLGRDQWDLISASLDVKPPFVGVQVPDDHARQLGLII